MMEKNSSFDIQNFGCKNPLWQYETKFDGKTKADFC